MAKKKTHQLALRSKFNTALLPAIQNLVGLGCSEADIGVILGYAGKDPREWIKGLKKRNVDVQTACELGKQMANIALVSRAFQLAMTGYDYEETETTYRGAKDRNEKGEEPVIAETKVKKRHTKPNPGLLQMLLRSRLPEDFKDTRLLKIDKKTLNVDVDGEIENLFGGLIDRKKVESHEVKGTENGTGNETSEDISS